MVEVSTITIPRAVVEQALEALELMQPEVQIGEGDAAIDALRAALAQQADRELTSDRITELAVLARLLNPPQIGAHWSAPLPGSDYPDRLQVFAQCVAAEIEKQQAEPVERKPLTEEEIAALLEKCIGSLPVAKQLIRAVEAAHGIKEAK
jgi:hypothetical protein